MIPTKPQWKKWALTGKATYAGAWFGFIGILVGVVGIALAAYFYFNPMATPPSAADEYVRRTNPVIVELAEISILRWEGDSEDAVTATLRNNAKVPADSVSVELGDLNSSLPRFESAAFPSSGSAGISIDPGSETKLPVFGIAQLSELLGSTVCAVTLEAPSLDVPPSAICPGRSSIEQHGFMVKIRYRTMFGEERTNSRRVWVASIGRGVAG